LPEGTLLLLGSTGGVSVWCHLVREVPAWGGRTFSADMATELDVGA